MQTQVKSRSAGKELATYIRQRINPLVLVGTGVFVFLFSLPVSQINPRSIVWFVFLIVFLFVFRLYDDILQANSDIGKPDRNYTDVAVRKKLSILLIVFFVILLVFASFLSWYVAVILLAFIGMNHVLYSLLINDKTASGFLPLIKYPFAYVVLQLSEPATSHFGILVLLPPVSLFIAFVVFESIDDQAFPVRAKYAGFLQISSFVLILLGRFNGTVAIAGTVLLSLSLISGFLRTRASSYLYFLCFLIFKLSVDYL